MNPVVYSIIAVAVDQITKAITRATMDLHDSVSILGDFFRLTYVENSGIAFGINFQGGTVVFTFLASVATVGVAWYLWKSQKADFIHRLFNVADSCVTVGMVLFLYSGYASEDGNSKTDEST